VHDGSQSWLRRSDGWTCVLDVHDPGDGDYFDEVFEAELFLLPHGRLTRAERMRISMELNLGSPRFPIHATVRDGGDLPPVFGGLFVDAPNVLPTAFLRESLSAIEDCPRHFGRLYGVRDPFVVRLVELEGRSGQVELSLPGGITRAARTDLLGQVLEDLIPRAGRAPFGPRRIPWSVVRLEVRPHEIVTVMLDLELGRRSRPAAAPARSLRGSAPRPRSS
jgi:hypothetical protein